MLYVAQIDNQSVAINVLKMNLITLSLWLESTKGNRLFSEYECVINLSFQFLVPKSLKYLKINSKTVAHVNIYGYIYIC